MCITFKKFATLVAEGKTTYSSESYWKGDAEGAGYKIKKLSGDSTTGDQTWGAFNEKDEKVGEFTEKEDGRGGWLVEGQINEMFGMFRNNEKKETPREKLKRETDEKAEKQRDQAKRNGQGKGKDVEDEEDGEEEDDRKKKVVSDTRSGSTKGTRKTMSTAQDRTNNSRV